MLSTSSMHISQVPNISSSCPSAHNGGAVSIARLPRSMIMMKRPASSSRSLCASEKTECFENPCQFKVSTLLEGQEAKQVRAFKAKASPFVKTLTLSRDEDAGIPSSSTLESPVQVKRKTFSMISTICTESSNRQPAQSNYSPLSPRVHLQVPPRSTSIANNLKAIETVLRREEKECHGEVQSDQTSISISVCNLACPSSPQTSIKLHSRKHLSAMLQTDLPGDKIFKIDGESFRDIIKTSDKDGQGSSVPKSILSVSSYNQESSPRPNPRYKKSVAFSQNEEVIFYAKPQSNLKNSTFRRTAVPINENQSKNSLLKIDF